MLVGVLGFWCLRTGPQREAAFQVMDRALQRARRDFGAYIAVQAFSGPYKPLTAHAHRGFRALSLVQGLTACVSRFQSICSALQRARRDLRAFTVLYRLRTGYASRSAYARDPIPGCPARQGSHSTLEIALKPLCNWVGQSVRETR